jgi:hypothetical protein
MIFYFSFSDGVIFVNQVSIPGSNIFELFPFLYKSIKPKSVPGLLDFLAKIKEMGLQEYIVLSQKDSHKLEIPSRADQEEQSGSSSTNWWFLN